MTMLKGLALTPPVVGRITIGRVVEKNGKRVPEKDDEFTLTTQVQAKSGWVAHPLDEALRGTSGAKLRAIPVTVLFDDPDLNLRAHFTLFDRQTGRPVCVGNGETCRRVTVNGMASLPCPSPEGCEVGAKGGCKPYGRLNVRVGEEDVLGSFVFRTTGFNSIRTLATRLHYFSAVSGGVLACLPLELRLRGKSTTQSHRAPIFYVDLTVRSGMTLEEAVAQARQLRAAQVEAGLDQHALDGAARQGLAAGAFEDSEEDGSAVVEEFYPPDVTETPISDGISASEGALDDEAASPAATLAAKLQARVKKSNAGHLAESTGERARDSA